MELNQHKSINRKTFLRLITWLLGAAFIRLWYTLTVSHKQQAGKPFISRIDAARLGTGIFLFDKFIVVKSVSSLKVFSNKCTHAGCRINREINGQLVCPCHGSRYDPSTGNTLQGPAGLPLSTIPFSTDTKTGEITITI